MRADRRLSAGQKGQQPDGEKANRYDNLPDRDASAFYHFSTFGTSNLRHVATSFNNLKVYNTTVTITARK